MNTIHSYRLPAEWEPQSGVQLTWPHAGTDWAPMLDEVLATYEEIAREIRKREALLIVGPPTNDTWARDHGFITLIDDSRFDKPEALECSQIENRKSVNRKLLDFKFNSSFRTKSNSICTFAPILKIYIFSIFSVWK